MASSSWSLRCTSVRSSSNCEKIRHPGEDQSLCPVCLGDDDDETTTATSDGGVGTAVSPPYPSMMTEARDLQDRVNSPLPVPKTTLSCTMSTNKRSGEKIGSE
ncbi:hypothetical protein KM043_017755 [Ampulex compressa]|nr:hypothetical protein KM043_017755 [Ampulex compressa]